MKAPFGKGKKTPEGNAQWYLESIKNFLDDCTNKKPNKKFLKQLDKYTTRMKDIVNGKWTKWPNTFANMIKIAEQMGKNSKQLTKIYTSTKLLPIELSKTIISIFEELLKIESDPNPLATELEAYGNDFVDELVNQLETDTSGNNISRILKLLMIQPNTHIGFLRKEPLKKLVSYIYGSDAHVSMNAGEIFEGAMISETHQEIISKYIGEHYDDTIEILLSLINNDLPTNQILGLKILLELLNRSGSIKQFPEQFLQDKENLQLIMKKMLDENRDIKNVSFELLVVYLFTPKDMKSDAVNDLLSKNSERLIELIESDMANWENETQQKLRKEAIDWLNRLSFEH